MNKKTRLLYSITGMMAFGIFAAAVIFDNGLNETFAKRMDIIAFPVRIVFFLIAGLFVGHDYGLLDRYLHIYFAGVVLYYAGIGLLLGLAVYWAINIAKKGKLDKSQSGHKKPKTRP